MSKMPDVDVVVLVTISEPFLSATTIKAESSLLAQML